SGGQRTGLILTTPDGVDATGRAIALGANTTAEAASRPSEPALFGLNMARIEPGNPGASWLLYKIEMAPHPKADAGTPVAPDCRPSLTDAPPLTAAYAPGVRFQREADGIERDILSDYVLGREM